MLDVEMGPWCCTCARRRKGLCLSFLAVIRGAVQLVGCFLCWLVVRIEGTLRISLCDVMNQTCWRVTDRTADRIVRIPVLDRLSVHAPRMNMLLGHRPSSQKIVAFSFRLPHGARCLPSRRRQCIPSSTASDGFLVVLATRARYGCNSFADVLLLAVAPPMGSTFQCVQSAFRVRVLAGKTISLFCQPNPPSDHVWSSCGDVFHL